MTKTTWIARYANELFGFFVCLQLAKRIGYTLYNVVRRPDMSDSIQRLEANDLNYTKYIL